MASNQENDPLLWRAAALEADLSSRGLILEEAKRQEKIQFREKIEHYDDSVERFMAISKYCKNYTDAVRWAQYAAQKEKSSRTSICLSEVVKVCTKNIILLSAKKQCI